MYFTVASAPSDGRLRRTARACARPPRGRVARARNRRGRSRSRRARRRRPARATCALRTPSTSISAVSGSAARRRVREWRGTWSDLPVAALAARPTPGRGSEAAVVGRHGHRLRASRGRAADSAARRAARETIALRKQPPPHATVASPSVPARPARPTRRVRATTRRMEERGAERRVALVGEPRQETARGRARCPAVIANSAGRRSTGPTLGQAFEQHRRLSLERHAPASRRAGPRRRRTGGPCWSSRGVDRRARASRATVGAAGSSPKRARSPRRVPRATAQRPPCATARAPRRRRRAGAAAQVAEALAKRAHRRAGARRPRRRRRCRGRRRRARGRAPAPSTRCSASDRRDVGVMMLHADERHAPVRGELGRVARAEEVRMQVVRDDLRLDSRIATQVRDASPRARRRSARCRDRRCAARRTPRRRASRRPCS